MENLPSFISIVFILTTIITAGLFYKASHYSKSTLLALLIWLSVQTAIGLSGFYAVTNTTPPRFALLIGPPILLIICLFLSNRGRQFIDNLNLKTLTFLHIIRIPVELVLFWLSIYKTVPELMTFQGRNFDIIAGLSAPIIYVLVFRKMNVKTNLLLLWNIICLGLLLNIVINAALAAPSPFQQFAFDQPNIAILSFPFNLLPSCVVPLVLLSHLAAIRQLVIKPKLINSPI
jgi:hypothetical protein